MFLVRNLPWIIEIALLVYCLIDCIQTDSVLARNLPKSLWVVLIVFVPIVGPVAWLVAGRPVNDPRARRVPWPSTRTAGLPEYERPRPARGPDDDPAFLAGLTSPDPEREQILADWEARLREREQQLRRADDGDETDAPEKTGEAGR